MPFAGARWFWASARRLRPTRRQRRPGARLVPGQQWHRAGALACGPHTGPMAESRQRKREDQRARAACASWASRPEVSAARWRQSHMRMCAGKHSAIFRASYRARLRRRRQLRESSANLAHKCLHFWATRARHLSPSVWVKWDERAKGPATCVDKGVVPRPRQPGCQTPRNRGPDPPLRTRSDRNGLVRKSISNRVPTRLS